MTILSTTDRSPILAGGMLTRIGTTPLIRLNLVAEGLQAGVDVYAKAEWMNPSGSVKDRPAAWILSRALEDGELADGRVLLDSTSGNMGIAYATFGASLGVRVHIVIPSNASPERLAILRALGADLTLTDPTEGSDGARAVAAQMAADDPARFHYADQYSHPANWQAHFHTTGPEILEQTAGRLTDFVAGLGTTGTLTGAGRYLRQAVPGVRVVGVQPATPMHGLEGLKHLATSPVPPIFDPALLTAASNTLPCGAIARVTNSNTGKSVIVKINDTGGFRPPLIIDLSQAAYETIAAPNSGSVPVTIEVQALTP